MIICMSDIICVTNRKLCREKFTVRIAKIAEAKPKAIILREKDLPPSDYKALAAEIVGICQSYGVPCILHSFTDIADELQVNAVHLPLPLLKNCTDEQRSQLSVLGASCHSKEDAVSAERLGCTYITAGHIFDTACKQGLPGRGLDFLTDVCESVSIPVYAIGGINQENYPAVLQTGAKGVCIMSGLMQCENPKKYLEDFKSEI